MAAKIAAGRGAEFKLEDGKYFPADERSGMIAHQANIDLIAAALPSAGLQNRRATPDSAKAFVRARRPGNAVTDSEKRQVERMSRPQMMPGHTRKALEKHIQEREGRE